jgi:hypothetical protein
MPDRIQHQLIYRTKLFIMITKTIGTMAFPGLIYRPHHPGMYLGDALRYAPRDFKQAAECAVHNSKLS